VTDPTVTHTLLTTTVALTLAAAAGLKLFGLAVSPVPETGWLLSPGLQVLLVQFEIALALWLLSGWRTQTAGFVTAAVFVVFAGVSLKAALDGQPSCGCFGKLVVNPWYVFAFDVAVAVGLIALRRNATSTPIVAIRLQPVLWLAGGTSVVIGSAVLAGIAWAGSIPAAVARLRGDTIDTPERIVQAEPGKPGEPRTVPIRVSNRGPHPIRIIGGTADCSCLATQDLPATVPPGETTAVRVTIQPGTKPGVWFRVVNLLTDDDTVPSLVVGVQGEVVE
jgi:hypothetical protein